MYACMPASIAKIKILGWETNNRQYYSSFSIAIKSTVLCDHRNWDVGEKKLGNVPFYFYKFSTYACAIQNHNYRPTTALSVTWLQCWYPYTRANTFILHFYRTDMRIQTFLFPGDDVLLEVLAQTSRHVNISSSHLNHPSLQFSESYSIVWFHIQQSIL